MKNVINANRPNKVVTSEQMSLFIKLELYKMIVIKSCEGELVYFGCKAVTLSFCVVNIFSSLSVYLSIISGGLLLIDYFSTVSPSSAPATHSKLFSSSILHSVMTYKSYCRFLVLTLFIICHV